MVSEFVTKLLQGDKNAGLVVMAVLNSGLIRTQSNSPDEAIALINELSDKMKHMVIQIERGVNGLPFK